MQAASLRAPRARPLENTDYPQVAPSPQPPTKGEDKWTYDRIDGARRTGETGEDATERWEYLIKWKGDDQTTTR